MNQGGQSGPGGSNGGQGNPNQVTTTISAQVATTTNGFHTSTTASTTTTTAPTSTSTDTASSSGTQTTAIIAGVLGGIGGLLIIALVAIYFLQRRKKKANQAKHGSAQPVTYTGLNAAFAGVPFRQPRNVQSEDVLLPTSGMFPSAEPSPTGLGIRDGGGEPGPYSTPGMEADPFLPSYAESQSGMSSTDRNSFGRLDTHHAPSSADVSPMSAHAHPSRSALSSQQTPIQTPMTPLQSPPDIVSPRFQLVHRDTMGFPVDEPEIPLGPYQDIPLVAPAPRHPLVHQESLERVARQGMSETPEPSQPTNNRAQNPHLLPRSRHSGGEARVLSQAYSTAESGVLGTHNPVRMQMPQAALQVQRNESQRTVSTVSSMGPSVISDGELERLGVGSRGRFG